MVSVPKFAHGVGQRLAARHTVGYAEEALGVAVEAVFHLLLGIESLYYAEASEGLFDIGHDAAPLLLPLKAHALEALAYLAHGHTGYRQEHEHKEGELPRKRYHGGETHEYHHRIFKQHIERGHDGGLDLGHVGAHARHDVALALAGEKPDREAEQLVVHHIADVAHHTRAYRYHIVGAQEGGAGLEAGHHHEGRCEHCECVAWAPRCYGLLHPIVEVVDRHIFERSRPYGHQLIMLRLDLEKHLQDRYHYGKRE